MVSYNCYHKSEDRNTSVLLERWRGRENLAGFHRIRFVRESHPGRMGFVILIGWKYMTRPTVKIIYVPNIRSSFCYKSSVYSAELFWGEIAFVVVTENSTRYIGIMLLSVDVMGDFAQSIGLGRPGFNPRSRLKKWYLIPPCLTLSIIRYRSMVKWSNPEKGVALSSTPRCNSYWKESLGSPWTFVTYFTYFVWVASTLRYWH